MKKTLIYSLLILLSVFEFSSCKKNNSHLVNYTTQGSPTTITYTDQNGNTQTVNNPASNWTLSFSTTDNGMTVKLTAVDSKGGNVGGKIYIDANQSAQSNGTSSSISISAIVP
jgi:hypothetical protein